MYPVAKDDDDDDDDVTVEGVVVMVIKRSTIYKQIFGKRHSVGSKESKHIIKNIYFLLNKTDSPHYRGPGFNLRPTDRPY